MTDAESLAQGLLARDAAPSVVAALRAPAHELMAGAAGATARHVDAVREVLATRGQRVPVRLLSTADGPY